MDLLEVMRSIVKGRLIPQISRDGLRRVLLPEDPALVDLPEVEEEHPREYHHRALDIGFILRGPLPFWLEANRVRLEAGDALLIPPHTGHRCCAEGQRSIRSSERPHDPTAIWIGLCPWGALVQSSHLADRCCYMTPPIVLADPRCYDAGEMLLAEVTTRPEGYEAVGLALLLEILARISRAPALSQAPAALPQCMDATPDATDLVVRAKQHIRRNFSDPLTLRAIADYLFVSQSHLSHTFKEATGQTVIDYLTEVRLATAKQLLETTLSVSRIASLVGFKDPCYFSRVFRRHVGAAPSLYRSQRAAIHPAGRE